MISNLGRIKRLSYETLSRNGTKYHSEHILKPQLQNTGYYSVRLHKNGKGKTTNIHRIVASTFLDAVEGKEFVNHIDGNKKNNDVANLEWCTRQENERHAWEMGLKEKIRVTSKKNIEVARQFINNKIPVIQFTLDGRLIKRWTSASDAMRALKIDSSAISKCCKNKLKKAGGYRWQYE